MADSTGTIRITAHRGAMAYFPENSLKAFGAAVDAGADEIELDVHASRDGVLVVNHDRALDRTTNGSGLIASKRWAELTQLWIHGSEPMCTFDDVAEKFPSTDLQIEIKDTHAVEPVLERMRGDAQLRERSTITSFNAEIIAHVAASDVDVHYARILEDRLFDRLKKFVATGGTHAACRWRIVNAPAMKEFRRTGGLISVWPCNTEAYIRRAINEGYYSLTTDDPGFAIAIRDEVRDDRDAPNDVAQA